MNGLQSGVNSGQISPQSFKNSNQTPGIQSTVDNSDIQSSSGLNQSINTLPATGKLVVVDQNPQTLGVSTPVNTQSSTNLAPVFIILAVSIVLAAYFFNKYFKLSFSNDA